MLGRGSGFIMGLLGLLLPGYLFYVTYGDTIILHNQGFFYILEHIRISDVSTSTELKWISSNWFKPETWGGDIEFYLYLASFALAVLALIIILGNDGIGSFLFLLAGILNLALLIVMYNNIETIFQISVFSGYPIPVGSLFLLLAGLVGRRD